MSGELSMSFQRRSEYKTTQHNIIPQNAKQHTPVSALEDRESFHKLPRFPREDGMVPENLLPDRSRYSNCESLPIEVGTVPAVLEGEGGRNRGWGLEMS